MLGIKERRVSISAPQLYVLKKPELARIKLFFTLWGYNTAEDKINALQQLITLETLASFLEL